MDNRYSYHREYCGHSVSKIVVRFCGEFIATCDTFKQADKIASDHNKERVS